MHIQTNESRKIDPYINIVGHAPILFQTTTPFVSKQSLYYVPWTCEIVFVQHFHIAMFAGLTNDNVCENIEFLKKILIKKIRKHKFDENVCVL